MEFLHKYKEMMNKVKLFFPKDSSTNPALFSPWSLMHFLSGFYMYAVVALYINNTSTINNFYIMMIVHTIYELKDLYITYFALVKPNDVSLGGLISNSSLYNSVGDTISAMLGWYFGYLLHKQLSNKGSAGLKILERTMFYTFLGCLILYNAMKNLG